GMYVAAHNIPGGSKGRVVLTNNAVIEAHSAGAAAGVIIGSGVDGLPLGTVHILNEAGGVIRGVSDAGAGLAISVEDPSAAYEEVLIVNKGTLEGDVILGAGKVEVQLLDGSWTEGNILFGDGENTAQVSAGGSHGIGDGFMLIG